MSGREFKAQRKFAFHVLGSGLSLPGRYRPEVNKCTDKHWFECVCKVLSLMALFVSVDKSAYLKKLIKVQKYILNTFCLAIICLKSNLL